MTNFILFFEMSIDILFNNTIIVVIKTKQNKKLFETSLTFNTDGHTRIYKFIENIL